MNGQLTTEGTSILLNYGVLGIIAIVFFVGLYYIMKANKIDKDNLMQIIEKKDKELIEIMHKKDSIIQENIKEFNNTIMKLSQSINEITIYLKNNHNDEN